MWVDQANTEIMDMINGYANGQVFWNVRDTPVDRFVTLSLVRGDLTHSVELEAVTVGPDDHWNYMTASALKEGLDYLIEFFDELEEADELEMEA